MQSTLLVIGGIEHKLEMFGEENSERSAILMISIVRFDVCCFDLYTHEEMTCSYSRLLDRFLDTAIDCVRFETATAFISIIIIMSYKAGIIQAISELKDRNGSSMIAIKKFMQDKLPKDKTWQNATFLQALKSSVTAGDLVQVKVRSLRLLVCVFAACKLQSFYQS